MIQDQQPRAKNEFNTLTNCQLDANGMLQPSGTEGVKMGLVEEGSVSLNMGSANFMNKSANAHVPPISMKQQRRDQVKLSDIQKTVPGQEQNEEQQHPIKAID